MTYEDAWFVDGPWAGDRRPLPARVDFVKMTRIAYIDPTGYATTGTDGRTEIGTYRRGGLTNDGTVWFLWQGWV